MTALTAAELQDKLANSPFINFLGLDVCVPDQPPCGSWLTGART